MSRRTMLLSFLVGITAVVVVGLAVMLGGDDGPTETSVTTATVPPGSTTVTSTDAATTQATTVTTAATVAPSSTVALGPCSGSPSAVIPASGTGVSAQPGDFDGDGAMDQIIGYQAGDGTFWVQIALSNGYATEMSVTGPAVALAAQSFAPGEPWLGLAQVGSGQSTTTVQFFQLDGCDIAQSPMDGGDPFIFLVRDTATEKIGITCHADGFTAAAASTEDGTNWAFSSFTYGWDAAERTLVSVIGNTAAMISPADDAAISAVGTFDCPFTP